MANYQSDTLSNSRQENFLFYFGSLVILTSLILTSFVNFLLFHTVAELFSIIIACSIFIVAWNTRHISKNSYLLFLGLVYLFVGILDLTHTLAYKGMNIFIGHGANLPTQLWIGARYLESISLALAPIFFTRKFNLNFVFGLYLSLTAFIFVSLFVWPFFPDCFIDGVGLTTFKKNSEYIICLILSATIIVLYSKRNHLDKLIYRLLIASLIMTIISEIAFTYYVSVYGLSNIIGHLFKIISFFLIYRAVISVTLTKPYNTLFREIIKSEKDKENYIIQLENAAEEIKTLRGIIPICSYCKKIRDYKGAWDIMEAYICKHSDAQFSHGVCPECYKIQMEEID
jgi:hypothetical protein